MPVITHYGAKTRTLTRLTRGTEQNESTKDMTLQKVNVEKPYLPTIILTF